MINPYDSVTSTPEAAAAFIKAVSDTHSPKSQPIAPLPMVQLTCANEIKPKPIDWLWDGWLARGKLEVLSGIAGTGKTTLAISLAATVSIGGKFPDGTRSPIGSVLIWSGEDSAKDTLVPRFMAAGADLSKIHFIGDVEHGGQIRSFDPAIDIAALNNAAAKIDNISLLIVDPIVNAVAGDSHKNGEVRRALQPLVEFGEKLNCAVLGVTHFSKGTGGKEPLERVTGSLAFGALPRIVLATAKITEDETSRRIFCRAKSNIGKDDGGFEYSLNQKEIDGYPGLFSSYILWGDSVEGSARDLLAEPDNRETGDDNNSALENAKNFLLKLLKDGSLLQKQIEVDARGAGHSWGTVSRAKNALSMKSEKMIDGWHWKLASNMPKEVQAAQDAQHAHINYVSALNTLPKIEHLRENLTAPTDIWET